MSETETSRTATGPTEGDPTEEAETYTTPRHEDDATEPPPAEPQGDGVPGPAPGAPAGGERAGGERAGGDDEAPAAAWSGTFAAVGNPSAGKPSAGKPPSRTRTVWQGEHRFDTGRPDGPTVRVDASAKTGPSPVDLLLSALSSCVAVDVVDILAKRRTPVESLTVDAVGERANAVPARVVRAVLHFDVRGAGIERVHAERAIELAVTKYCSVRDSLDPATPVEWRLTLNGE